MGFEEFASRKLEKASQKNGLRTLSLVEKKVDFTSNDYLGIGQMPQEALTEECEALPVGSGGSRLLSGNQAYHMVLEEKLAAFFKGEAALYFSTGYNANIGLFSAILNKGDKVLYDVLSHASIKDGIRLGLADKISFKHNCLEDLEKKLKAQTGTGQVYVVVEAVYSMDGDCAPVVEIAELCSQYSAKLIVDEAHSTGIFGEKGQGLCVQEGIEESVFARVHTFGKAAGCHGGMVIGPSLLITFLINFSRPFIYTTAPSAHQVAITKAAVDALASAQQQRAILKERIAYFKLVYTDLFKKENSFFLLDSNTPIQGIVLPGNDTVKGVAAVLQKEGFDVRAVLSPTVPSGKERLRICLHVFNSEIEIKRLLLAFKNGIECNTL